MGKKMTEAQLYDAAKHKNVVCPTCKRDLHNVRELLNRSKAEALQFLYNRAGTGWYEFPNAEHDPEYRKTLHKNHTKLPCWGLIESVKAHPKRNKKKWRLTQLGLDFVRGKVAVPKYVHIPTGNKNKARGKPFGDPVYIHQLVP